MHRFRECVARWTSSGVPKRGRYRHPQCRRSLLQATSLWPPWRWRPHQTTIRQHRFDARRPCQRRLPCNTRMVREGQVELHASSWERLGRPPRARSPELQNPKGYGYTRDSNCMHREVSLTKSFKPDTRLSSLSLLSNPTQPTDQPRCLAFSWAPEVADSCLAYLHML